VLHEVERVVVMAIESELQVVDLCLAKAANQMRRM
jgi:hypothetical protein